MTEHGTMSPTDSSFDGLQGDVVFCTWTGHNQLSPQRAECLLSVYQQTLCPVLLLTPANLPAWIRPNAPFHPAFVHLSEVHKADYVRCYMMHHFGGGYTDIKCTSKSWRSHFERMRVTPDAVGLGYTEIGPQGISHVPGALGDEMRANWQRLIGNCAYIFRKGTVFTREWIDRTHEVLDAKLDLLRRHPAQHPMDQLGATLPDGTISLYPLRWTEVLGEIFHPLVYRHKDRFLHGDLAPQFHHYR